MKKRGKVILTLVAIVAGLAYVPKLVVASKQKRLQSAQTEVRELTKQLPAFKVGTKDRQALVAAINSTKQEIEKLRADLGAA